MAQQTINIGAAANDGTGDTLRAAGTKLNAMFTELYGRRGGVNFIRGGDTTLYCGPDGVQSTSAQAIIADRIYAMPFNVPASRALTKLGFNVTTAVAGNARSGIYANAAADQPGARLVDGGQFDVSTTGVKEATISLSLASGLYWFVLHSSAAISLTCANAMGFYPLGFASDLINGRRSLVRNVAYAALPADESAQSYLPSSSATPFVWSRA